MKEAISQVLRLHGIEAIGKEEILQESERSCAVRLIKGNLGDILEILKCMAC